MAIEPRLTIVEQLATAAESAATYALVCQTALKPDATAIQTPQTHVERTERAVELLLRSSTASYVRDEVRRASRDFTHFFRWHPYVADRSVACYAGATRAFSPEAHSRRDGAPFGSARRSDVSDHDDRVFAALERASRMLHANALADPMITRKLAELDRAIDRAAQQRRVLMDAYADAMRRERVADLRRQLRREHLKPLIRLAKRELRRVSSTAATLRLPHANAATQEIVDAAALAAKAVAPHQKLLRDAGFDPGFLRTLRALAKELHSLSTAGPRATINGRSARDDLRDALRDGREVIDIVDARLDAKFGKARAGLVAEWRSARRIGGKPGPKRQRGRKPIIDALPPVEPPAPPSSPDGRLQDL